MIVTAVAHDRTAHLAETDASVAETKVLLEDAGHTVRWFVCVDGTGSGSIPGLGAADEVVFLKAQHGVSVARNVAALHASDDEWVFSLDGDDVLVATGVLELAELLSRTPAHVAWVATNRVELDERPTRSWLENATTYEPGALNAAYRHPYLFHPNNVAYRASVLFEAGGWPATPGGEDVALVLRISKAHAGVAHPSVTLRYRRWEQQTTADPSFRSLRQARHELYERFDLLGGRPATELREGPTT